MENSCDNEPNRKRQIEQVEENETDEDSSTDDDDENLFVPQARHILGLPKKSKVTNSSEFSLSDGNYEVEDVEDEAVEEEEEEDLEEEEGENGENEDDGTEDLEEQSGAEDSVEDNPDDEGESSENEDQALQGESIEELAAGREEKEEDEIMTAFAEAAQPQERNKPQNIKTRFMVTDLSFHPNEEIIAISNIEGEILLYKYSVEENECIHTLNHHKKSCRTIIYNDSGSLLFSASKDKSVVITDSTTMQETTRIPKAHSSPIYSLLCMDDNVWASGDDDGVVKVWDLRRTNHKPIVQFKEIDEFVSSMATNSQSRLLLCTSGEGTLTAFNTRARKMDLQSEVYPSEMNCLGLIRQETKVITGLGNGTLYIFDWGSFGYHSDSFGDHPTGINSILPVTENVAITGCDDGKIRAIHMFPHKFLGVVGHHRFPVERLDISTCGHIVGSSSHDGVVRFWDVSYLEDPDVLAGSTTKKSVRNKKRSLRKEKLGFQLPSSRRRNKKDFFAGLADTNE